MRFLKGLFWVLLAVAIVAVAVYLTGQFVLSDRLTNLYLLVQAWLPLTLDFSQFLVVLTVASVLVVFLILLGCAGLVLALSISRQKQINTVLAARRETDRVKERHRRQYDHLLSISQALAKQLDKRVLVQGIIEAASRMTSVPQANTVVSLWLLHFETDTIRFERGFYCDETVFTQTAFQPTDQPFSRSISTQQPWVAETGVEGLAFIRREKLQQLGGATGAMVVPLVIENSVLGYLVLCCHPDVLKSYEEQRAFYGAVWGALALALAIAVQGEVAILDRLTGVHNREYFMKRFIQEIERATRYRLPVSLLMVDIDNFKLVNDMLGHPQGDAVLKIISKLIKKSVRAIDLVGRYGGEEFIIMLPETGFGDEATGHMGGAAQVAERIRQAVDDEFRGLQKPLNLTVSVGVVCRRFPEDREQDYRELIRLADEQLYKAKATGKNKVCIHLPDSSQPVAG
jgi:diguanylate cyclase (GGDEF)-like protein